MATSRQAVSSQDFCANCGSANPLMCGLLIRRTCTRKALLCGYRILSKWYRTVQCLPPVPIHPVELMQKKSYSSILQLK
jgi:hypothetical protein